mmetsp:Transcript_1304/g.3742  ORF Transcript_1304/g.3742 Transcript_1304/m.3742 type:complete len:899 (+) Transcript_1304:106-2802(+)|eukprot:CAMPEP_0117651504 /NCGR_PEP_ID=MMETSP0804-20121206/2129_1 /TAXON_ID=1074897 /ORGANISM="Tetraselmis astigmatica, Strain CCMP880" /LENGTH=898 /DNA_ID=CAMNT_0005457489 /DNA_START=90 /DNA_END=2786 /DNA_ORIENTATION=+
MQTMMVMNDRRRSAESSGSSLSPLVKANYNRHGGEVRSLTDFGERQPAEVGLRGPSAKKTRFHSMFESSNRVAPFDESHRAPRESWAFKSMGSNLRSRFTHMSSRFPSMRLGRPDKWSAAVLRAATDGTQHNNEWLVDPREGYMRLWDAVTSVCLLFTALVTPYEVSFLFGGLNSLFWINRSVDLVFFFDMILQFFLIFYDETDDIWVQDHQRIAWTYTRSWFLIDLVSILPFDVLGIVLESSALNKLKIIRIIKLLRLAKLLRVFRAGRIFQRLETQINVSYKSIQLTTFAVGVALCAHWMACALHLNTIIEDCHVDDYLDSRCINWVYYYNNNGGNGVLLETNQTTGHLLQSDLQTGLLLTLDEEGYSDPPEHGNPVPRLVSVYWAAVYWAVMTMSTIGYGDVTPQTNGERVYVTIGMILGAAIYAYMVGNVCSIIASMSASEQRFRQEMDTLNSFLNANYVPKDLKDQLRSFYRYRNSNVTLCENQEVLRSLTPKLQAQVAEFTQASWLKKTDLFVKFPGDMVVDLYLSMRPEAYVPGEVMVAEGTACDRLLITERGLVWYRGKVFGRPNGRSGGEHKGSLAPRGVWIGTRDMMSQSGLHHYSAYSLTYTVVLSMRREVLETQLSRYPSVRLDFRRDLVRSLMKECVRLYAQAFRRLQSSEDIMTFLFRPNPGTMHQDNWLIKHKFRELLDLVEFRLGPDDPISQRIAAVKRATVIIQSAFRGFQSRKRLLAMMRYSDFVVNQSHGIQARPRVSIKDPSGMMDIELQRERKTSLARQFSERLHGSYHRNNIHPKLMYNPGSLRPRKERRVQDQEAAEDKEIVAILDSGAPGGDYAEDGTISAQRQAVVVAKAAYLKHQKLIKKLSSQMDNMQQHLSAEINDVKRMVRDIILETAI